MTTAEGPRQLDEGKNRINDASGAIKPVNENVEQRTTSEMFALIAEVMVQEKMSVDKAYHLLMEKNIDDLDGGHGPLFAAINSYCREKCKEDSSYEGILRDAYNNVRLRLLRMIRPKEETGTPALNPIIITIATIRHFIQGHD